MGYAASRHGNGPLVSGILPGSFKRLGNHQGAAGAMARRFAPQDASVTDENPGHRCKWFHWPTVSVSSAYTWDPPRRHGTKVAEHGVCKLDHDIRLWPGGHARGDSRDDIRWRR